MDVRQPLKQLRAYVEERDFAGYDPYDALNSPILRGLALGRKWPRIFLTQALRRLPFNPRPLLLIPAGHNPKALGLFLSSYAKLVQADPQTQYEARMDRLVELLAALKSPACSGNGWGYNFDWQSRAFFLPRFTPTIVNSAFVGHALLDAYETTGNRLALDLAAPISDFILNDLNRIYDRGSFCFSYTPRDSYPVHNANLLGASLLIRLGHLIGRSRDKDAALSALAYSLACQRADGCWFYSERPGSRWVDSFHTGFVLESIRHFLRLGYGSLCRDAYERGVACYANRFFLPDGSPKYFRDRVFPLDIHSAAEAVSFFSLETPAYDELAERVLRWMLTAMHDPRGYFYYQRTRYFTTRIPYMRWSQAWAFRALAQYLRAKSAGAVAPAEVAAAQP